MRWKAGEVDEESRSIVGEEERRICRRRGKKEKRKPLRNRGQLKEGKEGESYQLQAKPLGLQQFALHSSLAHGPSQPPGWWGSLVNNQSRFKQRWGQLNNSFSVFSILTSKIVVSPYWQTLSVTPWAYAEGSQILILCSGQCSKGLMRSVVVAKY